MRKPQLEVHDYSENNIPIKYQDCYIYDYFQPFIHWHSAIEVLYFYGGAGEIIIDGVTYIAELGGMYVVNQNQTHFFHGSPLVRYHCIVVDENFLIQNSIDVVNIRFDTLIYSKEAGELYLNIIKELTDEQSFSTAGIRSETLRFFTHLARHNSRPTDTFTRYPNINLQHALNYIGANFTKKISINDIAKEINLSQFYFIRIFKQAVGATPTQYINSLRCNKAKQMLKNKKHSINEIAVQCGFENASYFSKTFKKYTGMLPSDYSKHHDSLK